jgi:hypothetical protein
MCVVGAAWDKERARDLGGAHFHEIFGRYYLHSRSRDRYPHDVLRRCFIPETHSCAWGRTVFLSTTYMLFSGGNDHALSVCLPYHTDWGRRNWNGLTLKLNTGGYAHGHHGCVSIDSVDLHFRNLYYRKLPDSMPYVVNLSPGIQAPDVLFSTPMLFEVYGGGFDKAPGCQVRSSTHRVHYCLIDL